MINVNTLSFWLSALIGIPFAILICRLFKPVKLLTFVLLVVLTIKQTWSITFFSHEAYTAATDGLEVHIADVLAVILAGTLLLDSNRNPPQYRLPMVLPYVFFIFVACLSVLTIDHTPIMPPEYLRGKLPDSYLYPALFPVFEISKLLRGLFLFWVVANMTRDRKGIQALAWATSILIIYCTVGALIQRYVYGQYRVTVDLDINIFNVYIGMLGLFIFPFAFAARRWYVSGAIWLLVAGALVSIVLTVSRSSLTGYLFGVCLGVIICLIGFPNKRNFCFTLLALICCSLLIVKAAPRLMARFEESSNDYKFRERLIEEATLMARDHPLGVGLGNFSIMGGIKYAAIAHQPEPYTLVHNIFYLTLAEMGWPGLTAFLLIWLRYYQMTLNGLRLSLRNQDPYAYAVFAGAFLSSAALQVQNMLHFSFRVTPVFFLFIIFMAAAAQSYVNQKVQIRRRRSLQRLSNTPIVSQPMG